MRNGLIQTSDVPMCRLVIMMLRHFMTMALVWNSTNVGNAAVTVQIMDTTAKGTAMERN